MLSILVSMQSMNTEMLCVEVECLSFSFGLQKDFQNELWNVKWQRQCEKKIPSTVHWISKNISKHWWNSKNNKQQSGGRKRGKKHIKIHENLGRTTISTLNLPFFQLFSLPIKNYGT